MADTIRDALQAEVHQLRKWARESREGGWSTHQVDPMLRRANDLQALLNATPPPDAAPPSAPSAPPSPDAGKPRRPPLASLWDRWQFRLASMPPGPERSMLRGLLNEVTEHMADNLAAGLKAVADAAPPSAPEESLDLDEIDRVTNAAPKGPWGTADEDNPWMITAPPDPDGAFNYVADVWCSDESDAKGAAEFIARARTWVPALVAALCRAQGRR